MYCSECKKLFLDNEIKIKNGNNYYHTECLIKYLQNLPNKAKRMTNEQAIEYVDSLLIKQKNKKQEIIDKQENNTFEKAKEKIKKSNEINIQIKNQEKLLNYFKVNYKLVYIDKFILNKLENINNGTYKGLLVSISYDKLLSMFYHYQSYLNNNAYFKYKNGNGFKNYKDRLNYDIAVILSKSEEYSEIEENRKNILDEATNKEQIKNEANNVYQSIQKSKQINQANNKRNIFDRTSGVNIHNIVEDLLENKDDN